MIMQSTAIQGGEPNWKERALERFRNADYAEAIKCLKEAEKETSKDPEIYYYLGYFTHYLCYDSRPLPGYNMGKSDLVLEYLKQAVELDPDYGNAYYFMGAEYGARARICLMKGDVEGAREEFRLGRAAGGYPDWLLEYGRNTLNSCRRNAILIMGGDADTNPVQYLQVVEGFRNDVTALPAALMSRPWFIKLVRDGIEDVIRPAPLSWSEYQIMSMHPYKWRPNSVQVKLNHRIRDKYGINAEYFSWLLKPDISENRLSAGSAALADIIAANAFQRPVYFSLACGKLFDLEHYLQLSGFVTKLVPVKTRGTDWAVDTAEAESVLLDKHSYRFLSSVAEHDMPRVSGILVNYPAALLQLCSYQLERGRKDIAAEIFELIEQVDMEKHIDMGGIKPTLEEYRKTLAE
jgi:tetratricopeptide (TPR) repeat protein